LGALLESQRVLEEKDALQEVVAGKGMEPQAAATQIHGRVEARELQPGAHPEEKAGMQMRVREGTRVAVRWMADLLDPRLGPRKTEAGRPVWVGMGAVRHEVERRAQRKPRSS